MPGEGYLVIRQPNVRRLGVAPPGPACVLGRWTTMEKLLRARGSVSMLTMPSYLRERNEITAGWEAYAETNLARVHERFSMYVE